MSRSIVTSRYEGYDPNASEIFVYINNSKLTAVKVSPVNSNTVTVSNPSPFSIRVIFVAESNVTLTCIHLKHISNISLAYKLMLILFSMF